MGILLAIIYGFSLLFIFTYSLVQIHLVVHYLRARKVRKAKGGPLPELEIPESEFPLVTVQLPIYNEMYVVERLIDSVCEFDYPKDKFEVQVLDDSTDETVQIIANKVKEWADKGFQITHVRRPDRKGFKAGALEYGLKEATGEFIAIFDADFLPEPGFLRKTLPYFTDAKIGVVQTRWEHINEDYSLLTQLQAFALDAHFSVEQGGRNAAGYFINFNGTAGVWRRETITSAGGWQADTLTEDLDLSYRAQLKGWKFKFLETLYSPAELPAQMGAIKSQQFRWTKGAAETARKNLGSVLRAKLPAGVKLHATFHLLNSFLFICILTSAVLSVPLLWLKNVNPIYNTFFQIATIFMFSLFALIVFFYTSRLERKNYKGIKFILAFPLFLSVSMGLSLHNAIATMEGYLGIKSPFIRTPKFNIKNLKDSWSNKQYSASKISLVTILEGILLLYFAGAVLLGVYYHDYGMIPYHSLLLLGFGTIFYFSVRHSMVRS